MKKNFILTAAIIVLTTLNLTTCIEPITTPDLVCNLGAHLGIGENCGGTNCTLKNYNTSTGADAFPVPIYRIGAESSFTNASATPAATAANILTKYASLTQTEKEAIKNGVPEVSVKLTKIHIFNIQGKLYSWDKSVLGLQAEINTLLDNTFRLIGYGTLPEAVAQLQPSINEIYLALGLPATIMDIPLQNFEQNARFWLINAHLVSKYTKYV